MVKIARRRITRVISVFFVIFITIVEYVFFFKSDEKWGKVKFDVWGLCYWAQPLKTGPFPSVKTLFLGCTGASSTTNTLNLT